MIERLEKAGYAFVPATPDAMAARLAREARLMEQAARDSKITPQ